MSANKLMLCNLEMNNVQLPRNKKIVTGSMIGAKRSERSKHRIDIKKTPLYLCISFWIQRNLTSIVDHSCSHHINYTRWLCIFFWNSTIGRKIFASPFGSRGTLPTISANKLVPHALNMMRSKYGECGHEKTNTITVHVVSARIISRNNADTISKTVTPGFR